MSDMFLDATGLNCPLPILKTKKILNTLPVGKSLEVLATDPNSLDDFKAFCKASGHKLLNTNQDGEVYRFLIICNR
jgi:tRNA 2-thiouridine synthesizing protein A